MLFRDHLGWLCGLPGARPAMVPITILVLFGHLELFLLRRKFLKERLL